MGGLTRRLAPLLPLGMTVWCSYDAVMAAQQGHTGKAVWEGVKAVLFIGIAYVIYDTGRRFSDS